MTMRHKAVLKLLSIDNPNCAYDIFLSDENTVAAKEYIGKGRGIKIVLNPFASSKHRTIKPSKVLSLIDLIKSRIFCSIFILCPPSQNISCQKEDVFIFKSSSILSAAALIKECDIVISPDTSIIHIACAFKKKTIGLYLDFSQRKEKTDIIWGPNNPNAFIINVDTKGGALENDVKNIQDEKIVEKLEELI
jgi:ADP-heptose:LPS heptosyltransferase